jgi:fumarate reductase flavoprotein subunit
MAANDQWDLAVIGGGIAGLTAAARGAELGLRVILLEKGTDERYLCNSRVAGGVMHIAYHDIRRSPEELVRIMCAATGNDISMVQAEALAEDADRLVGWLTEQGSRFMKFSHAEAHRWCMAPPRPLGAGLVWEGRGPDRTLRSLTDRFKERGGTLVLGAAADSLLMGSQRCIGVTYTKEGQTRALSAGAVLIADGGFQSDPELFRKYIGPRPDLVLQRGTANGMGSGLRMAHEVGASLRGLDRFYGHLLVREAMTNTQLWPYPEADAFACAGIIVGADGKRVADESRGGIGMANFLAKMDDPTSTTAIFDADIWEGPGRSARFPANPYIEKFGGTVIRAISMAELADKTSLPEDQLAKTIADYNEHVRAGTQAQLTPPRKDGKPMLIEKLPLMALPLCAGITYTMGGIEINENAQVMRPDGSVIQGLYAAGATTGGIEGGGLNGRVGYVGGLIKAAFGLRAAEKISVDALAVHSP